MALTSDYKRFEEVLFDEVLPDEVDTGKREGASFFSETGLRASAGRALDNLSPLQLASFYLASMRIKDGDLRIHVEREPWFGGVKHLFTEKDGRNVTDVVRQEVDKAAKRRAAEL